MNLEYYKQKQIIAKVDKSGNVIGKIEKWEAHKKGILHKALTIALIYKDFYLIQHRKHPAFDGVFDITSSSHQLFAGDVLQTTLEATYDTLKREWNLEKTDLKYIPKNLGTVYYKAKDPKSIYTEHEMCEILICEVNKIPRPNFDFAYGFSLIKSRDFMEKNSRIYFNLAPWVKTMIKKGFV
jgi:isopentenyldiphosphate isomerase